LWQARAIEAKLPNCFSVYNGRKETDMPTNQVSNQKAKGGRQQTQSRPQSSTAHEESSSSGYGAIGEMAEQASDYVSRGAAQATDFAREHGGATVAVAIATGFGIGLLVGHAIGAPRSQPRRWKDRIAAEGLGRRMLDRIESMIPDALAEHFNK
jgi:hypothetical protein